MNKQAFHKSAVVFLLMMLFLIPFFLQRSSLDSVDSNAYMAGAGIRSGATPHQDTIAGTAPSAWTSVAGNSFIGSDLR